MSHRYDVADYFREVDVMRKMNPVADLLIRLYVIAPMNMQNTD